MLYNVFCVKNGNKSSFRCNIVHKHVKLFTPRLAPANASS